MPNVPINDIKVYQKDLVVATQGRAIWMLDDLTPLHQLTPQLAATAAHLFKPRDGYRTRTGANILGRCHGVFPPRRSTGSVTLDILDSGGKLIQSYNSEAPPPSGGGRRGGGGGGGGEEEGGGGGGFGRGGSAAGLNRVTKSAGMNRFVWDPRYPGPLSAQGRPAGNGPVAPPGQYTAKLTVGDVVQTQSFTLLIDPRIAAEGITIADLRAQFDHNMKTRDLVSDVNRVVARVEAAQKRLASAGGAAADTAKQLEPIADELLTPPIRYSKPGLRDHITYLNGMTNSVDQKVGRDAIERYQTLRKELDDMKAKLNRVLGPERRRAGIAGPEGVCGCRVSRRRQPTRSDYSSSRRARAGSARMARMAGQAPASSAANSSVSSAPAKVTGSWAEVWNSSDWATRPSASAATTPMAMPAQVTASDRPATVCSSCGLLAPSALRTLSSKRRCATSKETTP